MEQTNERALLRVASDWFQESLRSIRTCGGWNAHTAASRQFQLACLHVSSLSAGSLSPRLSLSLVSIRHAQLAFATLGQPLSTCLDCLTFVANVVTVLYDFSPLSPQCVSHACSALVVAGAAAKCCHHRLHFHPLVSSSVSFVVLACPLPLALPFRRCALAGVSRSTDASLQY